MISLSGVVGEASAKILNFPSEIMKLLVKDRMLIVRFSNTKENQASCYEVRSERDIQFVQDP